LIFKDIQIPTGSQLGILNLRKSSTYGGFFVFIHTTFLTTGYVY